MAKGDLETLATILGMIASIATIAGYFQRTTCPCDREKLPLFGDTAPLGTRYCAKCGHDH